MQKIVTNLWFDGRAEEAAEFYTSLFPDSRVNGVAHYGDAGPGPKGDVMSVDFVLAGQEFTIINGGPGFPHSPAMSLLVNCEDQAQIDRYWEALSEGGQAGQCGWLTDRYGVSWQVVPTTLGVMILDEDQRRARRVMEAMLKMGKLDVAKLQEAFDGEQA